MGAVTRSEGLSADYTHTKRHNIVLFGEFTLIIGSSYAGILSFFGDYIYG